jgi:tetratricopeptide (TPR) repeat protein
MRKNTLGSGHRDVAASLSNLANLLQSTKRYSEAERLYQKSLKLRKKVYGPRHPNVAMCMSNMAILMQATGRNAQAEALFKGALRLLKSRLGPVHERTAYTEANLADFLLTTTGRTEDALPLAEHAWETLRATLPAGHRYNRWAREVLKRAKAQTKNGPESPREAGPDISGGWPRSLTSAK